MSNIILKSVEKDVETLKKAGLEQEAHRLISLYQGFVDMENLAKEYSQAGRELSTLLGLGGLFDTIANKEK